MENETKLCPYCKEEIKIEAVKCKHCGEFLNTKTPLKIRPLKPQNYNLAFYAAYLAIVISIYIINSRSKYELFMSNGFPDNNDIFEFPELLFIFGSVVFAILTFFILWELGKYLRNFDNKKINKNTWIFFLITITLQILIYTFQTIFSDGDFKSIDEFTRLILIILLLVFGIKIIKLKNDFIGGLKFLGGCFIVYALFFWNLVSEDSRLLFLDVLFIVIIYIFYKAKKNSLNNKKSLEDTKPIEIS